MNRRALLAGLIAAPLVTEIAPTRATGGVVRMGQAYIVGERNGEAVIPNRIVNWDFQIVAPDFREIKFVRAYDPRDDVPEWYRPTTDVLALCST